MACEITRPDPQVLFDRQRDMFASTVLRGSTVIPESNEWYVVSLNYAVAEEFYAFSEQSWKERDPRYACCDNLLKIAAADGVYPYAATFAQGYIEITGDPGATIPETLQVTIGSATYVSVGTLESEIPATGHTTIRVRSETAGVQGNGQTASTGTLTTAVPGIQSAVTVYPGFCGGTDAESCEQLRSRYLRRKQFAPKATAAWIEEKLLEWPCATRVCRRAGSCCTVVGTEGCSCGTGLDYYVFFDNTFDCGIAPQCVIDQIQEWMFGPDDAYGYGLGQVEVGVCGKVYAMRPAVVNLTISDYGCISNSQKAEIRTRMAEFFATLCPSVELAQQQFTSIVGSVIGFSVPFDVELTYADDAPISQIGAAGCGIELDCDAVACLGEITFIDSAPDAGAC